HRRLIPEWRLHESGGRSESPSNLVRLSRDCTSAEGSNATPAKRDRERPGTAVKESNESEAVLVDLTGGPLDRRIPCALSPASRCSQQSGDGLKEDVNGRCRPPGRGDHHEQ